VTQGVEKLAEGNVDPRSVCTAGGHAWYALLPSPGHPLPDSVRPARRSQTLRSPSGAPGWSAQARCAARRAIAPGLPADRARARGGPARAPDQGSRPRARAGRCLPVRRAHSLCRSAGGRTRPRSATCGVRAIRRTMAGPDDPRPSVRAAGASPAQDGHPPVARPTGPRPPSRIRSSRDSVSAWALVSVCAPGYAGQLMRWRAPGALVPAPARPSCRCPVHAGRAGARSGAAAWVSRRVRRSRQREALWEHEERAQVSRCPCGRRQVRVGALRGRSRPCALLTWPSSTREPSALDTSRPRLVTGQLPW